MDYLQVLKAPLVTEKLDAMREEQSTYAFEIDRRATKVDVREAIEKLFKVRVLEVRTAIMRGKKKRLGVRMGRQSNWKRALVKLQPGQKLDIFEGGA
jgi:large subunit ribosomal protein L23